MRCGSKTGQPAVSGHPAVLPFLLLSSSAQLRCPNRQSFVTQACAPGNMSAGLASEVKGICSARRAQRHCIWLVGVCTGAVFRGLKQGAKQAQWVGARWVRIVSGLCGARGGRWGQRGAAWGGVLGGVWWRSNQVGHLGAVEMGVGGMKTGNQAEMRR